ncbi:MAG: GPR endopeptidase [Eubacteriales bacterium]
MEQSHSPGARRMPHTDLAYERHRADLALPGVTQKETAHGCVKISELVVDSDEGAASLGKPKGNYITLFHPHAWSMSAEEKEVVKSVLGEQLKGLYDRLTDNLPIENATILVVGLGNGHLTADAVGPRAATHLTATRHIKEQMPELFAKMACSGISVFTPGVMFQTGMEAADLVACAAQQASPNLIIAIDALAARSLDRLASTIQLSDTGITPGSGVGNHRRAIDRESLQKPVIAIGVPTVVESKTLVADALEAAGIESLPTSLDEALGDSNYFVSPKDVDEVTDNMSKLIAEVLNEVFGYPA